MRHLGTKIIDGKQNCLLSQHKSILIDKNNAFQILVLRKSDRICYSCMRSVANSRLMSLYTNTLSIHILKLSINGPKLTGILTLVYVSSFVTLLLTFIDFVRNLIFNQAMRPLSLLKTQIYHYCKGWPSCTVVYCPYLKNFLKV